LRNWIGLSGYCKMLRECKALHYSR